MRGEPFTGPIPKPQSRVAEKKKREKRIKKIEEELAELEQRIASAESERGRNDLLLCSEEIFRDGERVKKIQSQNTDLKAMIELLSRKWEQLATEKENLESSEETRSGDRVAFGES